MAARTYLMWLVIALISGAALAQSPQIKWAPDLATARQASSQFKVPLLIHFYGDACLPCRTLEKNVLSNPEVIGVLNKFFICVSINGSRDRNAMSEFEVHSYPTDVFLSPTGEKLYQGICPQDLKEYLATLERVAVMNRDYMVKTAANKPAGTLAQQSLPPALSQQSAGQQSAASHLPGLPPAGNMTSASPGNGNSNTPGFYMASGAALTQQQLQLGTSSSAGVQSGPLLAGQQPPSIRGAVQNAGSQIEAATGVNGALNAATTQIPSIHGSNANASTVPHLNKTLGNSMQNYAQLPQVDSAMPVPQLNNTMPNVVSGAAAGLTAATSNAANRASSTIAQGQAMANNIWSNVGSNASTTTENPHFNPQALGTAAQNTLNNTLDQVNGSINNAASSAQHSLNNAAQNMVNRAATTAAPVLNDVDQFLESARPNAPSGNSLVNQGVNTQVAPNLLTQAAQPSSQQPKQPQFQTVSSQKTTSAEPTPAIDGFCPVSLRGKQWRKGNSQFAVKHRGLVFWFADQACADAFMQSPDYFTPILMGCDPMLLLKNGELQPGSTQFGLFEDRVGPLFFSSAENKAEFLQEFAKNMAAIEAIVKHASTKK